MNASQGIIFYMRCVVCVCDTRECRDFGQKIVCIRYINIFILLERGSLKHKHVNTHGLKYHNLT